MQKEYMAVLNNGWKLYEGTGNDAKQIYYVEGDLRFYGTEIKTWEDIEAAVAIRNLIPVLKWSRMVTFVKAGA